MLDRRQALKAAAALAVLGAPGRGRADASAVVALSEQRYRYLVDVALNRGTGFRFVLDTGATTHFVSSRVARQLDLPQIDVRTVRGFAGPNRDPVVRAERLRVGGLDLGPAQLVEWPAEGLWSLCFITEPPRGPLAEALPPNHVCIFVPCTPNPTTGYLVIVDRARVRPVEVTTDEAFKLVMSLGIIQPEPRLGTHEPAQSPVLAEPVSRRG